MIISAKVQGDTLLSAKQNIQPVIQQQKESKSDGDTSQSLQGGRGKFLLPAYLSGADTHSQAAPPSTGSASDTNEPVATIHMPAAGSGANISYSRVNVMIDPPDREHQIELGEALNYKSARQSSNRELSVWPHPMGAIGNVF